MSSLVVTVVLCAALLHAGWNALVKAGKDRFLSSVLVVSGAGLIAAAIAVLFLGEKIAPRRYAAIAVIAAGAALMRFS